MNNNLEISEDLLSRRGLPRGFECLLAAVGIVVLFPLFLICSAMVMVSSRGPVFFRQSRVGFRGETFTLYKFRTMVVAEKGVLVTAAGDHRVTKVGRVLRRLKFDELPELYNVLRGDMSFVGPRPEVPEYVDLSDPLWARALSVRPGITDPVTLELRNEEAFLAGVEDTEKFYKEMLQPYKLKGSINYLERRTPLSDMGIVIQTLCLIVLPRNWTTSKFEEVQLSTTK